MDATVQDWYTFQARSLPFLEGQEDTPAKSIVFPLLDAIPFRLHFVLQVFGCVHGNFTAVCNGKQLARAKQ